MKKKLLILAALIVLAGAGWGLTYLYQVKSYQNKVANLTVSDIPFSRLADGTYVGECDVRFIDAKVQVSVKNGKVTRIDLLKHKNGHGAPAEVILKEIVTKQSLEVDAVSGASNSSKVLKKAVENALVLGMK
ncbi:FMN-binding protein [Paenibacillus sabinae]|uniref:FMN-binding domain-containing protein n=1 Tax=Paenibacillus sabinae T27 TaxID=1268072 RepID=X4Z8I7_9BACL|nr:FMN-binding protein [Paenibacillus sabinae]AHV96021.1 FMN-binding domain-containing protein [Paenibacillus sabinae T27]